MRILIIEDNRRLAESLRDILKHLRYEADISGNGLDGYEQMMSGVYDGIILDVMLPGMDGITLLREARRRHCAVPVLMLTAKSETEDRVNGLESGADDYVVKPFGIMELQARVKAVLRRTYREDKQVIVCGNIRIDPAAREVTQDGVKVDLTYKEFELLRLLAAHRGVVFSRDDILQTVWDYDYTGETRTVDMHVKTLRQKLGDDIISTVRGVGYKMN